jgi:hypothetical protein
VYGTFFGREGGKNTERVRKPQSNGATEKEGEDFEF